MRAATAAIERCHGRSRSSKHRCRGCSCPPPRGRSPPAMRGIPRRRPNAEGGYNYAASAAGALTFLGWTTGVPQQAGHVAPDRIAGTGDADRNSVHFVDGRRRARRCAGVDVPARISGPGVARRDDVERQPVAEGQGSPGTTTITFAPVSARFVRITQTANATDAPPWSMRLLRLYEGVR